MLCTCDCVSHHLSSMDTISLCHTVPHIKRIYRLPLYLCYSYSRKQNQKHHLYWIDFFLFFFFFFFFFFFLQTFLFLFLQFVIKITTIIRYILHNSYSSFFFFFFLLLGGRYACVSSQNYIILIPCWLTGLPSSLNVIHVYFIVRVVLGYFVFLF